MLELASRMIPRSTTMPEGRHSALELNVSCMQSHFRDCVNNIQQQMTHALRVRGRMQADGR